MCSTSFVNSSDKPYVKYLSLAVLVSMNSTLPLLSHTAVISHAVTGFTHMWREPFVLLLTWEQASAPLLTNSFFLIAPPHNNRAVSSMEAVDVAWDHCFEAFKQPSTLASKKHSW